MLIGGESRTQWLSQTVQRDAGYILTGRNARRAGKAAAGITGPGRRAACVTSA